MEEMIQILNACYPVKFERIEPMRDMGSTTYTVFSGMNKYFLRVIKPAFFNTAIVGADIQFFLQNQCFPVPCILLTNQQSLYVKNEKLLMILYEFIEGSDSDPEKDAEAIGALVGRLHQAMLTYPGELVTRDKHFFIGRYIDALQKKGYQRINEYKVYGDALWEEIKNLPRGYCHGDMYDGNIRKAYDGKLYIHDFDTSCEGFPMYDATLICNMTDYFVFDSCNYDRSNEVLSRFVPEYKKNNALSQMEIDAFHYLIAIQHFSTQATIMEIFGIDCIDEAVIDSQLEWLYQWRGQCHRENPIPSTKKGF
jgi:Ser/Thr protein kinase RdoA (MazF antagonist)